MSRSLIDTVPKITPRLRCLFRLVRASWRAGEGVKGQQSAVNRRFSGRRKKKGRTFLTTVYSSNNRGRRRRRPCFPCCCLDQFHLCSSFQNVLVERIHPTQTDLSDQAITWLLGGNIFLSHKLPSPQFVNLFATGPVCSD